MPSNYYSQDRSEMMPFVPSGCKRTLEVGCGEGAFSASLPNVEEKWGIEPTQAAAVARTRLTTVLQTTFEEAEPSLPKNYFDLVVCNDVIEHMHDHSRFLSTIGNYISPRGMLIGSIPNVRYYENVMQFLLEKDWMYRDYGILDRTHMAFFTAKSLRRTLERSGFKVARLTGINPKRGFTGSARDKLYLAGTHALSALTLGYFSDLKYLQFGFQATPRHAPV